MKQILNKLMYRIFSARLMILLLGEEECANYRKLYSNSIVYTNKYIEVTQ